MSIMRAVCAAVFIILLCSAAPLHCLPDAGAKSDEIDGPAPVSQDGGSSWTEKVQAYTSIATLIVTLLGFALVVAQLRQTRKSLDGSTHAVIYTQQHAINQMFVDYPELRPYFYDDKNCEAVDPCRARLLPAADMMADFFEQLTSQHKNLPAAIWPAWGRFMAYVYSHSPIIREHFDNRAAWYEDDFVASLKQATAHRQQLENREGG